MVLVADALYANAPHIRQVAANGWQYVLSVKPDSHKSLFKQFEWRRMGGRVKTFETISENRNRQRYSFTDDLFLCDSAADVTRQLSVV